GTPESSAHSVAASMTFRPFYAPKELAPRGPSASCVFKKADGSQYEVAVPWSVTPRGIAGQIDPPARLAGPPPEQQGGQQNTPSTRARLAEHQLTGRDATFSSHANWVIRRDNPEASVLQVASLVPFYFTGPVTAQYAPVEVKPKTET